MTDEKAIKARDQYMREWKEKNRERVQEYHREYNARPTTKEYMKKWRQENRERINEYNRKWRNAHPDKIKEYTERYWKKKAEAQSM